MRRASATSGGLLQPPPWNNEEGEGAKWESRGKEESEDESERMGEENGYFLETSGKERREWL